MYHNPVLLYESIDALNIRCDGTYIDATFGGGGHSRKILEKLTDGRLFAFDQDPDAQSNHPGNPNFTLIQQNFRYMINYLRFYNAIPVDGILADLGISSHQIDVPERGFSTRFEAPLDMRMDRQHPHTAADLLNHETPENLAHIFKTYGEIKNGYALAKRIVSARTTGSITTTRQLNEIAAPLAASKNSNKYLAQVYQALRIIVNDELGALEDLLYQSTLILKSGGKLVIISYHSLEDRLVKNFFKSGNTQGKLEKDFYGNLITPFTTPKKQPLMPTEEEQHNNPRSRSARLRIGTKI